MPVRTLKTLILVSIGVWLAVTDVAMGATLNEVLRETLTTNPQILAAAARQRGSEYDVVIPPAGTHSDINDVIADPGIANIKRVLVAATLTITTNQVIDKDDMEFVFKPQAIISKGGGSTKGLEITGKRVTIRNGKFKDFVAGGEKGIEIGAAAEFTYLDGCLFTNNDEDVNDLGANSTLHALRSF